VRDHVYLDSSALVKLFVFEPESARPAGLPARVVRAVHPLPADRVPEALAGDLEGVCGEGEVCLGGRLLRLKEVLVQ
jgi:hypothetical protein